LTATAIESRQRAWALGLLLVIYVFNFIDRSILSILLQPIKAEFHPSDTALGLLSGIAFAVIYSLGIPIGAAFGVFAGGWTNEWFGWRTAFLVLGLPGVALAGSLHALGGYGVATWNAAFLMRMHRMGTGEAGSWLAGIALVAGGLGTYFGAVLADQLGRRDARWNLWLPGAALLVAAPFSAGFYLLPIGAASDGLARAAGFGDTSLRWALLLMTLVNFWAAVHYFLGARTLRADLARVAQS
jgi:MFS family permease